MIGKILYILCGIVSHIVLQITANNNKVDSPCKLVNACLMRNQTEIGSGFSQTSDGDYHHKLTALVIDCDYYLQSAEVDTLESNTVSASANVTEQILGFVDDVPGVDMKIPQPLYRTLPDKTFNSELGEFLRRPTMIHEFTWTEGASIAGTTIDPWTLFLNNPTIKKKIDNYAYMRCNLKLKFVINASPFYYGALLMSYQPLSKFTPANILIGNDKELIPYSQRPNITLYPQNS